jgi:hypothetical protein
MSVSHRIYILYTIYNRHERPTILPDTTIFLLLDGTFLATTSAFATANAFGSSSPKNSVIPVSAAVIVPSDALGNISSAVATNKAVLWK